MHNNPTPDWLLPLYDLIFENLNLEKQELFKYEVSALLTNTSVSAARIDVVQWELAIARHTNQLANLMAYASSEVKVIASTKQVIDYCESCINGTNTESNREAIAYTARLVDLTANPDNVAELCWTRLLAVSSTYSVTKLYLVPDYYRPYYSAYYGKLSVEELSMIIKDLTLVNQYWVSEAANLIYFLNKCK